MTTFFQQELVEQGNKVCQKPGCAHAAEQLLLVCEYHPAASVTARYSFAARALVLFCNVCKEPIVTIAVALNPALSWPPSPSPLLPSPPLPPPSVPKSPQVGKAQTMKRGSQIKARKKTR